MEHKLAMKGYEFFEQRGLQKLQRLKCCCQSLAATVALSASRHALLPQPASASRPPLPASLRVTPLCEPSAQPASASRALCPASLRVARPLPSQPPCRAPSARPASASRPPPSQPLRPVLCPVILVATCFPSSYKDEQKKKGDDLKPERKKKSIKEKEF